MKSARRQIGLDSWPTRDRKEILPNCNLSAALSLVRAGFFIHPCDGNKRPLTRWRERSTSDQKTIEEWWQFWPDAIPAIDCGKSGVLIIDADRHGGPDGVEAFQQILRDEAPVDAPVVETAGNGRHYYFCNPDQLRSSTHRLARSVDVRGDGGYVIAPGATLPDGRGWRAVGGQSQFIETFRANRFPLLPRRLATALSAPTTMEFETQDRAENAWSHKASAANGLTYLFKRNIEVLRSAVEAIPHDDRIDMNTWIAVIGAICDETDGSEEGRNIAHEWSATWIKGYDEHETERVWLRAVSNLGKSALKASGKTIRLRASKHGWTPPTGWSWPDGWNRDIIFPDERPKASRDNWPEPQPLPNGLARVAPFNRSFLPENISPWVADIAERMQCPPDFVGVSAMVALGSVIGRKVGVRPQRRTDWLEVPNLWGCIIGRPGAMKSPAMAEALKPLNRLDARAREDTEAVARAYVIETEAYKLAKDEAAQRARKALKGGREDVSALLDIAAPEEPKSRRYIVNDSTYEALGSIMSDNPNGVLAFRDELVSLLKTLDREDNAAARGFFLTAWNGTSGYTFDRIIRGKTHIPAACLSLLGSTQPGRIAEYIRRASGGAGI